MTARKTGFTLVELTVGLVILGICMAFTVGPIVSIFEAMVSTSEARELCDKGSTAMRRMVAEIREAEEVTLAGDSEINVVKAHAASDGYDEVAFYLDGSTLYRKGEPDGTPAMLAENVETFEVTNSDVVSLRIEISGPGEVQFEMEMDIYPMNLKDASTKSFYNDDKESGDWQLVIDDG
jgi:prepilin-type N-terminal cleavage/methylation domain-containing protein